MLVIICMLFGAMLAQRCKLLVMVPAIVLVTLVTTIIGAREDGTFWHIVASLAVNITTLQVGYVVGLVVHYLVAHYFGNDVPLASMRRGSLQDSMSSRRTVS
jgi:hypothetical protein